MQARNTAQAVIDEPRAFDEHAANVMKPILLEIVR